MRVTVKKVAGAMSSDKQGFFSLYATTGGCPATNHDPNRILGGYELSVLFKAIGPKGDIPPH